MRLLTASYRDVVPDPVLGIVGERVYTASSACKFNLLEVTQMRYVAGHSATPLNNAFMYSRKCASANLSRGSKSAARPCRTLEALWPRIYANHQHLFAERSAGQAKIRSVFPRSSQGRVPAQLFHASGLTQRANKKPRQHFIRNPNVRRNS